MSRIRKVARLIVDMKNKEDKCLRALYYFFKVFGMAPYDFAMGETVPISTNIKKWKFTHSRTSVVYNIILLSCIVISSGSSLYLMFSGHSGEVIFFMIVVGLASFNSACIIGSFIANHRNQIDIFNKLNEMRESIYEESRSCNYGKTDISKQIKLMFLLQALVWLGFIILFNVSNHEYNIYFMNIDTECLICTTMVLQYSIAVTLINNLFVNLNRCIAYTLKRVNQAGEFTSVVKTVNDLSRLWNHYDDMRKISAGLSNFYSFVMLPITVMTFENSTVAIYHTIKPLICGGSHFTIFDYGFIFFNVLRYICPYTLLTTYITTTVDQSKKTRNIICDFLREARSNAIADKMTQFVIYLTRANFQFTIFDLFPLNGSFLFAMLGTCASYLIIIIQFEAKNCELHSAGVQ